MDVMRKTKKKRLFLLMWGIMSFLILPAQTYAQVSGVVTDQDNEPIVGASVLVKGTSRGTITDFDGRFQIAADNGATLVISYLGYKAQEVTVTGSTLAVRLVEDTELLDEVVVIGYGAVRKQDLSGSVVAIKAEEINRGAITSPQELLQGRVSGLFVLPGDGAPGAGATMRIRSGASLNASNDPLIVIDGIPVSNDAAPGTPNALATINPNDIESFSVLKDASATAIFGSRASNGVIIINTKKGAAGLKINYSSTFSAKDPYRKVDVMDADEFYRTISTYYPATTSVGRAAYELLNQYPMQRTNWQDAVYRTALATDQNVSVTGKADFMPYRVSVGYTNENGTLKTSNYERYTGSLTLNPTFLDDHLSVIANLKGTINNNRFADSGVVGAAAFFDPTKPVHDPNGFHGYWNHLTATGAPNLLASNNPLQMLYDVVNEGTTKRSLGNIQLDYKMHFLPELRANLNMGYDVATSTGQNGPLAGSFQAAKDATFPLVGTRTEWNQLRRNQLFDFYLNYKKYFESIRSNVDVMGGYSYQHFYYSNYDKSFSNDTEDLGAKDGWVYRDGLGQYEREGTYRRPTENFLVSFFGRLNYNFMDRYLLTATLRRDGSSRFSKDNRWGMFPSAAFAWTISEESFMRDIKVLSLLKLRLGYGVTGQQDINQDYGYIPTYAISTNPESTYLGSTLLKPNGYNRDLKWEETSTKNIAVDFGFLNNRINGSIEYYKKDTKDMLIEIFSTAGTAFTNRFFANVGEMNNKGIEFNVNAQAIQTRDFSWDVNYNITWNTTEIERLTPGGNNEDAGIELGGPGFGTGLNVQRHINGSAPYTFFLYQQVYGTNGKPIQNVLVDRDGNNVIAPADRYMTGKSPSPDVFMGFGSLFRYKQIDLGFNMRASLGNYVFNSFSASNSTVSNFGNQGILSNLSRSTYTTEFKHVNTVPQLLSDYFLENASFLKMDNLTVGYNFSKILTQPISGRLSFSVQNVFTITNYSGLDPENSGIDNNIWPRARTYTLGVNLNF